MVLEATFDLGADRGRLTNQIVLEPPPPSSGEAPPAPTTAPATAPSHAGGG
jgi:hypothetical protein